MNKNKTSTDQRQTWQVDEEEEEEGHDSGQTQEEQAEQEQAEQRHEWFFFLTTNHLCGLHSKRLQGKRTRKKDVYKNTRIEGTDMENN